MHCYVCIYIYIYRERERHRERARWLGWPPSARQHALSWSACRSCSCIVASGRKREV